MAVGEDLAFILVLGVSNSGKSTLINWMLGSTRGGSDSPPPGVFVRDSLDSKTHVVEEVSLCRTPELPGVVLVDTPGFDHSFLSNEDVLGQISAWLLNGQNRMCGPPRVAAILYCHDISSDFFNPTMSLDLDVLTKLCGPEAMKLVTFVTLKWDQLRRSALGEAREEEVRRTRWSRLAAPDEILVERVQHQSDAARVLSNILTRVGDGGESPLLQIQKELVRGIDCFNTQAGSLLNPSRKPSELNKWRNAHLGPSRKLLHGRKEGPVTIPAHNPKRERNVLGPELLGGGEGDIVVLVTGEVHSGKSTLIKWLTGVEDIEVGKKLTACTQRLQGFVAFEGDLRLGDLARKLSKKRFVFIDTPGFDETRSTVLQIADWLHNSREKGMSVGAILYLHDISREDLPGSSRRNLDLFSKLWDDNAIKLVSFVTTKWDRLSTAEEGHQRARRLERELLRDEESKNGILDRGASLDHLQHPRSSPDLPRSPELSSCPYVILERMVTRASGNGFPDVQIRDRVLKQVTRTKQAQRLQVL